MRGVGEVNTRRAGSELSSPPYIHTSSTSDPGELTPPPSFGSVEDTCVDSILLEMMPRCFDGTFAPVWSPRACPSEIGRAAKKVRTWALIPTADANRRKEGAPGAAANGRKAGRARLDLIKHAAAPQRPELPERHAARFAYLSDVTTLCVVTRASRHLSAHAFDRFADPGWPQV